MDIQPCKLYHIFNHLGLTQKGPDLADGADLQVEVVGLTLRAAVSDNNGHRPRLGVIIAPPLRADRRFNAHTPLPVPCNCIQHQQSSQKQCLLLTCNHYFVI